MAQPMSEPWLTPLIDLPPTGAAKAAGDKYPYNGYAHGELLWKLKISMTFFPFPVLGIGQ